MKTTNRFRNYEIFPLAYKEIEEMYCLRGIRFNNLSLPQKDKLCALVLEDYDNDCHDIRSDEVRALFCQFLQTGDIKIAEEARKRLMLETWEHCYDTIEEMFDEVEEWDRFNAA